METEDSEAEREPLQFDVNLDEYPPEMQDVMLHIKELAEKLLYKWKSFPIVLPPSITDTNRISGSGYAHGGTISFHDLFMTPTFDELEEVAIDTNGVAKRLDKRQLENVRKFGEFDVDSLNFPGQSHKWRLSQLLQKGTRRAHNTLLKDAALSLRILIITARNRFHSHFFSVSQSFKAIAKGLWQLLDIFIGMPYTTVGELLEKLHEEHARFLVAELHIRHVCKSDWLRFCNFVRDKCSQLESEKNKTTDFHPPPAPYKFQTPKGSEIDLRLFNRDMMQKCTVILKNVLEKESKGWYVKYKDKIIGELKEDNLSHGELTERVNQSVLEEYLRRVYSAVLSNEELENLHPKLGLLLVHQAKAHIIMLKALESTKLKYRKHSSEHRELLVKSCPVKAHIPAWVNERVEEFMREFVAQNQWCPHQEAIDACRKQHLDQAVYFMQRDLTFMRDREPVLRKELSKVRHPVREYTFPRHIWLPSRWIVHRHLYGEIERIPTVIIDTPTNTSSRHMFPDEPKFSVKTFHHCKSSTRHPFWRWRNYVCRAWTWTWDAIFWLGIVIPWCSPVSLRSLVCVNPYMPDMELNQINGTLCPKQSSLTQTMISRLRALWNHIISSRSNFESTPDTGFLGRSFTRQVNRAWNYGVKGALGSVGLVLVMVPLCILSSLFSVIAALCAPVWVPIIVLFYQLGAVVIYDFDHPYDSNAILYLFEAVVFRLLIQGCLQPICAIITALLLCPIASFAVILVGIVKRGIRAVWDAFMFHAVIKKRARIPASDSFIARRIAGPGLAANYFYQVHPEQVLAASEAQMELHELEAWSENILQYVEQPKVDFRKFVDQCFGPFSAGLSNKGVYEQLEKDTKKIIQSIRKTVDQRKQQLSTGLTSDISSKVKLTGRELKVVVTQTAKLLDGFYPDHVIRRLDKPEEEFWEDRRLEPGDWKGLAHQILTEIFSSSFLIPLEETDTCFRLELQHLNLSRYVQMLKSAEFRDDLDVVSAVHTPKGDIDVDAPYLEAYTFNPMKQEVKYAEYLGPRYKRRKQKWPWKRGPAELVDMEKMQLPCPVPHPSLITLLIYNRENDQDPLDLEDIVCQRIMRAAEGTPFISLSDPNTPEFSEVEGISTPDYTTNSEPDATTPQLAEPKRAFSEEPVATSSTQHVTAMPAHSGLPGPSKKSQWAAKDSEVKLKSQTEGVAIKLERIRGGGEPRVMYHEREADTSCVLSIGDEDDISHSSKESHDSRDSRYESARAEQFTQFLDASKSGTV